MRRKSVFIILLASIFAFVSIASAKTKISFFYPVGVAGPLVKVINGMVDEFEKENPDIDVEPVYAGNYNQTMQKVQTAVLGGNPPDIAVVEISELFSLLQMDLSATVKELILVNRYSLLRTILKFNSMI